MNFDIISNIAQSVCRKTKSFEMLDDIKQEIALAVFEKRITETIESMTSFAWKYYKKETSIHRVYLDFDLLISAPSYYENNIYRVDQQMYNYNLKFVNPVYELRAEMKTFKEIGDKLGISRIWANCQVINTIHLPIVSTYLKNKSFEATKVLKGRRFEHPHGENFSLSKLTDKKVIEIRKLHKNGMSYTGIAEKFNIAGQSVGSVVRRRTWKHVL